MKKLYFIPILFISWFSTLNSQTTAFENLTKKITNKQATPLQAYKQLDSLLTEAINANDAETELKILSKRYEYDYLQKIDFEQMISAAQILKERAQYHNNLLYEAKAYKYLAQVYTFNGLYEKALKELSIGLKTINKVTPETPKTIMERANIYTAFTNTYTQNNEPFKGIQYIYKAIEEHGKLTNPEQKRGTQFMDYANLGGIYLKVNLDSAKYYAEKSITYSKPHEYNHNLMFLNYLVIGNVHLAKKDYPNAEKYYKKAEAIKEGKYFMNIKELYKNLIKTYAELNETELKKEYELKLKDLSLTIAQSQNNSLRKIIQNDKNNINSSPKSRNKNNYYWILGALAVMGLGIIALVIYKRKKTITHPLTPKEYNELIDLLKDNDQKFLLAFDTKFPHFSKKLLKENANLTNSEIELLAMVKLGITNKEISQYKYIQHRTVQNKRYFIRKKLNLASDIDLNKWIEHF
ncbi:DNA-binding CsgD family transcriptional regulator [Mesonia hippocampi]|uniref:DNA-binding CsgD family transcriptional regulator n=1 Tax=Mesonia hippocampi TaxID=1628250 RepID=A0A840EW02_9FLAO|nr:helix-turn-helix transcriptional regulator [Mesonia hippocampi]MBB4118254.1 DNA-binding CsgD family transcriptional regulator [Mesonia hippocampi]